MKSVEVQQSDANDSAQQLEAPARGSVFDYLYHDARRVGSFLAQFETYGVPSQVKATEGSGRSETTRTTGGADLGVPGVIKAQTAVDATVSEDERDTAERTYDPLWSNARALLDYLTEHNMMQRDLWSAGIGQFVLVKGSLIVLDVAMLKEAWGKPSVKSFVTKGAAVSTPAKPKGKGKAQGNSDQDHVKLFMEMLSIFPHSIQAHLMGDDFSAWGTLSPASLAGMSSDLVLKHGSFVPGVWHVLGILDATPDPRPGEDPQDFTLSHLDTVVAELAGTLIGTLTAQLAPMARQILGRPRGSFGITPLLVFRDVAAEPAERSEP